MTSFYMVGQIKDVLELQTSGSGMKMRKIKVSVFKQNSDEQELYEVVLFRQLAENEYNIDDLVAVSGKLSPNNYTKDGASYYNVNLVAYQVAVLRAC